MSRFIFSGREVVTEVDDNYGLKAAIIRGHEILAQKDSKDSSYYYFNNAHGDVTALLDGRGEIVNRYKYDAFGNTVEAVEKVHNRFRYAGEQFDPVTGQYYLRARFYNPVIGRFTQEDTYRGDGLNLYAYVQNNPVKYVDPSGYCSESKQGMQNEEEDFTTFYTVQSKADKERILNGGEPWPDAPNKSALGEGVYAWGNEEDAKNYLNLIKNKYPESDVEIVKFKVSDKKLAEFKSLNVDSLGDDEAAAWMERYSKLWGGTPEHGLEYIQRGTNIGVEHFFDKSIFKFLDFS